MNMMLSVKKNVMIMLNFNRFNIFMNQWFNIFLVDTENITNSFNNIIRDRFMIMLAFTNWVIYLFLSYIPTRDYNNTNPFGLVTSNSFDWKLLFNKVGNNNFSFYVHSYK